MESEQSVKLDEQPWGQGGERRWLVRRYLNWESLFYILELPPA